MRIQLLPVLALALLSSTASVATPKPRAAAAPKALIELHGYAPNAYDRREITDRDAARQSGVIARTAARLGDASHWLAPNDPVFQLLKKNPSLKAEAELLILFDANGKFDLCSVTSKEGSAVLLDNICERIRARAKITLPMARDGQKFAENFKLFVEFDGAPVVSPPPLLMVPPPPPDWWNGRPPGTIAHMLKVGGLPLIARASVIDPKTDAIGLTVRIEKARAMNCYVGSPFRAHADADLACKMAMEATYAPVQAKPASLPLLFFRQGGNLSALVPIQRAERDAKLKPGAIAALTAMVAQVDSKASIKPVDLRLLVDPEGGALDCWLTETSGSDQADLKICEFLMDGRHFIPGQDIFGRASVSTIYGLELGGKQD